jgi:hypothetical protein
VQSRAVCIRILLRHGEQKRGAISPLRLRELNGCRDGRMTMELNARAGQTDRRGRAAAGTQLFFIVHLAISLPA